jgi:alpha-D-ribose 1-methylphosphonate 5-triphosphate synthase subunit PhnG
MGVLARASVNDLDNRWKGFDPKPAVRFIRAPETGLAMVRGRTGGTGEPFNLGEITLTRCVVQLTNGLAGFSYVKGRSKKHAELAAVFDALLQDERYHDGLMRNCIEPLQQAWRQRRQQRATDAQATRVDFFTLVRGESL